MPYMVPEREEVKEFRSMPTATGPSEDPGCANTLPDTARLGDIPWLEGWQNG